MGNCLKRQSREQWAGEDWGPAISSPVKPQKTATDDNLKSTYTPTSKSSDRRELKVKLTKKQLEEVIKKMKMEVNEEEGFTVQQVLEHLMKMSEAQRNMTPSAWKPKLQTIPEFKSFHSSASDRSLN